jgi:transposase
MTGPSILGIDVSKDTLDVCLLHKEQTFQKRFGNRPGGHQELLRWLRKQRVRRLRACLEATGLYGEEVAQALYEAGYQVSVVNPVRIKKYADSQLRRNKTDRLDAQVIASFCATQELVWWTPPAPEWRELRDLVRHLDDLMTMRQQERNRRASGIKSPAVITVLEQHITYLDDQIEQLTQLIHDHFDRHPDLKRQRDLLRTIPGIADTTATHLLAEVRDFLAFDNPRQVVAFAGLNPCLRESGSSLRGKARLSKTGSAALRAALYMPALSAKHHNPLIRPLCERIEQDGQPKMVAIGAAMRKLLHQAYGVLKTGTPFDPDYLSHPCVSS